MSTFRFGKLSLRPIAFGGTFGVLSLFLPVRSLALMFVVACIGGLCSPAYGQRGVPRDFWSNKLWLDQMQQINNEQKKAFVNQATEFVKMSERQMEELSSRLSKVEETQETSQNQVRECERAVENSETALRTARQKRTDRVEVLLVGQDEKSPYHLAQMSLRDAEVDCAKQSERILNRPVMDGSPDKLKSALKKSEFQKLESDKECVNAFRRCKKAKEEKLDEEKHLILKDRSITQLDELIRKLNETVRKQKSELLKPDFRLNIATSVECVTSAGWHSDSRLFLTTMASDDNQGFRCGNVLRRFVSLLLYFSSCH